MGLAFPATSPASCLPGRGRKRVGGGSPTSRCGVQEGPRGHSGGSPSSSGITASGDVPSLSEGPQGPPAQPFLGGVCSFSSHTTTAGNHLRGSRANVCHHAAPFILTLPGVTLTLTLCLLEALATPGRSISAPQLLCPFCGLRYILCPESDLSTTSPMQPSWAESGSPVRVLRPCWGCPGPCLSLDVPLSARLWLTSPQSYHLLMVSKRAWWA